MALLHIPKSNKKTPVEKNSDCMIISALSRPMHLGMLYNAENDQLIPGFRIWTTEAIDKATRVNPQPETKFQVSRSESLSEKLKLLNVNGSIKLSFFGGLIEAGGSGCYLNSSTSSMNQCSVSLSCHSTTEFKELVISELDPPDDKNLPNTDATHVVVGVLYGADAIMEFQETPGKDKNKRDVQENLNVMIKKIPSVEISGDGSLKMNDDDKKKVKNFSCNFFGDFNLKVNPTTYEEAVKVYKELPTLLGEKGEKAVPLKVWLYPLNKLIKIKSKLKNIHVISEMLVSKIEKAMDDFHLAELRVNDLLTKSKEIKAEDIIKKLKKFQRVLRVFTAEFLQEMSDLIPEIRGGKLEETALKDLLKCQDASGFSRKDMKQWLDVKDTEINIVMMYIKKIQKYTIRSPGSELDSILMDPDVTDAYVFSFTSLGDEEPYLKKISQAAKNFKSESTSETPKQTTSQATGRSTSETPKQTTSQDDPWYKIQNVKDAMLSTVSLYNQLISNEKGIITFISDPKNAGASIRWYNNATLKNEHVTSITIQIYACKLMLDLNTIHKNLWLSDGNRKITCKEKEEVQQYPDHKDRYDTWPQVLCTEGLKERSYWEVEWSGRCGVVIAVAYESIGRKGVVNDNMFENSDKSWCLECQKDQFRAYHNKMKTDIPPVPSSSRVGVYLDWPAGTLSFYSVYGDTLTHLHTFKTKFTEPVYPGFQIVHGSSISLC